MKRVALLAAGYARLGAAGMGLVLPLVPATPFLLLMFWAFTRSSPALAARLRRRPRFGRTLRDWQEHGALSWRAKHQATGVIVLGWVWLAALVRGPLALAADTACIVAAAAFVLIRPIAAAECGTGRQPGAQTS